MQITRTREVIRYNNRFGGEDLVLTKGKGRKYFTIEYEGVRLILDSTELFDLLEMLKEVYKEVK